MFKIVTNSVKKLAVTSIMLLTGGGFMAQLSFAQGGGDLMEILPVTDKILMIHIRDGHIDTYGIWQGDSYNKVYHDPTDTARAVYAGNYLISSLDDVNYSTPLNPVSTGRKSKGWEYQSENYSPPFICQHLIYIELPYAMKQGHTYTVQLDNITGNMSSYTIEFDVNRIRSETVKVNMVGFPQNGPKFAYLSHWMGDFSTTVHMGGGLNLDDKAGNEFRVIDYATGETAFTGTIAKRMARNTRETSSADFPSGNYTNADVWECDFSDFTTPGEYVVAVDGIGRSFPFEIDNDITREAYYYAMKGLFWQRQGIVVEVEPDSIRPRGHHPDDIVWRFDPEWHGQGYDVSEFNTDSPQVHGVWGHYYDAGDWDGYVSHNRVPAHLLLLYDLAPEGFHDGDVGNRYKLHEEGEWIDEGTSGRPDLLDEAVWLLEYNRRARHILMNYGGTGGVPGYVGRDAITHGNTYTAWLDTREWYISGNNVEATYMYAGNAAYYAININRYHHLRGGHGDHPEYSQWMKEANESWQWAERNSAESQEVRRARGYAAAVLYRATGDRSFQGIFAEYWQWEPSKGSGEWAGVQTWNIAATLFGLIPDSHPGLDHDLKADCRNHIIARAVEKESFIRNNGFRCGMEYNQFLQLGGFNTPRVTVLGAAHRLTGDDRYLEAMQHTVNYVLGGNQLNMTYLSGLGERSDQWIFQPNAYLVSNKNSMVYTPENYIGQTSYFGGTGLASSFFQGTGTWKWSEYFSRMAAYPTLVDDPGAWPGAEQKFRNRYSIQGGEFTVHQQMNHMIFAMGYINAMARTSDDSYTLAPRPEVSLNLVAGQGFDRSGDYLSVTASGNTRRVEYYYDWRFIGESTDKEKGFMLFWEPQPENGSGVLVTAVAYSDRGRRSLPSEAGEKKIIVRAIPGNRPENKPAAINNEDGIRPYRYNPWYWEYKGEPIMLVGASDRDNLWQWTGTLLTDHLDRMKAAGGNYVRNTMSDRNDGDTYAAKQRPDGKYDITQWNDEYWNKLKFFLEETNKRDIIVQLTLWDWFDLSGDDVYGRFRLHPLNPENNINWEPGTITNAWDYYGGSLASNNKEALDYQHRFIDKLISVTSQYGHVLYNIGNESGLGVDWDIYWGEYIKQTARNNGRDIYVTTMLFAPDATVRRVMNNNHVFSFADVSQNNQDALGPVGRKHWDNLLLWRKMIAMGEHGPMPINNEKVYGNGVGTNTAAGTEKEAVERFWRNVFGGAASTRFHRPAHRGGDFYWGIGLSERAEQTLRAVNMFLEEFDVFSSEPWEEFQTVGNSVDVYCLADMGKAYAIYFPGGRATVHLDPWLHAERVSVKWLDVASLTWSDEEIIEPRWDNYDGTDWWGPQRIITLAPNNHRSYVAVVKVLK